jgi:hypothetical protein
MQVTEGLDPTVFPQFGRLPAHLAGMQGLLLGGLDALADGVVLGFPIESLLGFSRSLGEREFPRQPPLRSWEEGTRKVKGCDIGYALAATLAMELTAWTPAHIAPA